MITEASLWKWFEGAIAVIAGILAWLWKGQNARIRYLEKHVATKEDISRLEGQHEKLTSIIDNLTKDASDDRGRIYVRMDNLRLEMKDDMRAHFKDIKDLLRK